MIKASLEILQPINDQSFLIRKFDKSAFEAPYHFHEEYELTYILKGSGKRYVGNHMEDFAPGDLVLLGPNLPHCWKLDTEKKQEEAGAIVIQFGQTFLGAEFFNKAELLDIKKLLQKSACGASFNAPDYDNVKTQIFSLCSGPNNFKILTGFLEVLQQLALSAKYVLLDQTGIVGERTMAAQERINPVFAYVVENFRGPVSLNKAAGLANMTPNAFCKYFKKITRKTFMETIIEYRLNYAIQQLVQTDKPIVEICFESGFSDASHFYKTFKEKMNYSPLNYRKRFVNSFKYDDKKLTEKV